MNKEKVTSIAHLQEILKDNKIHDFVLYLGGGCLRSSKEITLTEEGIIEIFHGIDGTIRECTIEDFEEQEPNIIKGVSTGSFYHEPS